MPELAIQPAGQADPNLPPLNLPTMDLAPPAPSKPLRIKVSPEAKPKTPTDPYEAAGFTPYEAPKEEAPKGDPYAGFTEYTGPKEPPEPDRYKYIPERIYETVKRFVTTPGKVYRGEVDPLSEEAIGSMADLAMFANPTTVARGSTIPLARIAEGTGPAKEAARLAARTSGQSAAETAANLGAPLGRGFTSDSPAVQAITARVQQLPFIGPKLTKQGALTVKAAGDKITDIVEDLTPTPGRAAGDVNVKSGLNDVIAANKQGMNEDYGALRNTINPDQIQPMPALRNAVNTIKLQRQRSGTRGDAISRGLEEVETLANEGGGFNGAHLRRQKLDEGAQYSAVQPSLSAKENRMLRAAITQDLKSSIVPRSSTTPQQAQSLFDLAEFAASRRLEQNKGLQKLADAKGEGTIANLLGAAKKKGGNARLLGQLRSSMPPEAFQQVAGTLLHELGREGEKFSLARFSRGWSTLSDEAKNALFSPEHQRWIDDIASLGSHLKDVTRFENHSNTTGTFILFELGQMGVEAATGAALGAFNPSKLFYGAAGAVASLGLMRILASPAKAAAASAWVKAYRSVSLGAPTPARIGVFIGTTRNLAHNLGLREADVLRIVQQSTIPANAETQPKP